MSASFSQLGNDLYTGARSVPVVARRRTFYTGSAVLLAIAVLGLVVQGLNLSLEFKGGSEFRVSGVSNTDNYEARARDAVEQGREMYQRQRDTLASAVDRGREAFQQARTQGDPQA